MDHPLYARFNRIQTIAGAAGVRWLAQGAPPKTTSLPTPGSKSQWPNVSHRFVCIVPVANRNWLLSLLGSVCFLLNGSGAKTLEWKAFPPLPDPEGFAGMYAGATDHGLIAAGGHHFSNGIPWWDGGKKVWSDVIYTLEGPAGPWRVRGEKLPRPLGDGVGVGYRDGIICAGGGDATQAYHDVFSLRWTGDRLETSALPPLPSPCLKMGGALVGDVFFLVGGRDHPNSTAALHTFVALDLSRPEGQRHWVSLPAWPGPARMMPVVAASRDCLYVFGGIEIATDDKGRPKNLAPYLSDAYRYRLGGDGTAGRWEKLANLPRPVAGAPTPAWLPDEKTILILGGVDGAIEAITDRSSVRALPDDILAYDIGADKWTVDGRISSPMVPRVNAPTVPWQGGCVVISGEHLPARRTNACTFIGLPGSLSDAGTELPHRYEDVPDKR